jgi:hypothetical protein
LANNQRPTTKKVFADDQRTTTDDASDELFMEEALRAAQRALEAGEVPVGAVVVVTIDWATVSCLLQLNLARCAREP